MVKLKNPFYLLFSYWRRTGDTFTVVFLAYGSFAYGSWWRRLLLKNFFTVKPWVYTALRIWDSGLLFDPLDTVTIIDNISTNFHSALVDQGPHQTPRNPAEHEIGKCTTEEYCCNLNAGMFLCTYLLNAKKRQQKNACFVWCCYSFQRVEKELEKVYNNMLFLPKTTFFHIVLIF